MYLKPTDKEGRPLNLVANGAAAVTPNDDADLANGLTNGIYVGASGDLAVTLKDGSEVTFAGLAAGMIHPIAATRVKATGTTATNIVAVY